jgi:YVTN family beta-propeller protein
MNTKSHLHFLSFLCLLTASIAAKDKVVATINVGVTPAGLAITPDGRTAYVANNNNYGIAGQDSVSVLNLKHNLPETVINDVSFNEPYTITINPAGTRAYVTNSNSTTITIIDININTVIGVIGGFDGPSGMAITPDGAYAYVNNYGGPEGLGSGNGRTVNVVDLNINAIIGDPIEVGIAPAAVAITPNGHYIYVANYVDGNPETGTVSIIDTNTNTVVATIPNFSGPFAIAITPNGKYAYITNFGSNNFAPFGTTVSVLKLSTNTIKATIDVGIQPAGIAISPNGDYAYVTNYNTLYAVGAPQFADLTAGQGTINIIETKHHKVIAPTIAVGQSPANIAIAPNGKHAYVSNYTSNTVNVIKLKHH